MCGGCELHNCGNHVLEQLCVRIGHLPAGKTLSRLVYNSPVGCRFRCVALSHVFADRIRSFLSGTIRRTRPTDNNSCPMSNRPFDTSPAPIQSPIEMPFFTPSVAIVCWTRIAAKMVKLSERILRQLHWNSATFGSIFSNGKLMDQKLLVGRHVDGDAQVNKRHTGQHNCQLAQTYRSADAFVLFRY